jgi:uncharacterized membrane protein YozB (DUF420 family)
VVSKNEDSGQKNEDSEDVLTEQDLILGKKVTKYMRTICVAAFMVCMAVAVFVFISVPLDTSVPYDGKYNRGGGGVPMPITLVLFPVALILLWRTGKKPDAHHMGKGARVAAYIIGTVLVGVCVYYHFVFAEGILVEGGYLAG